ncbi:MAG: nitroreductase [Dehalococcoidia bacterium]|nr:nitroreductase [Dehalococcoidia bacterium]
MDIVEAINQRKSIRAFKPDPVPKGILKEIMELALRAPSWANTQPWQFAVVGGKKLEDIRQAFLEKAGDEANPDLAGPREFPEPYGSRPLALGMKIAEVTQVRREDSGMRRWWQTQGLRLYGAPAAIYVYTDRSFCFQRDSLNVWPIFDCGLVAENIMLLAAKYGLGTVPQMQAVHYPDVLRELLGIPDSKLIVLGIAIGYPDWDDPMNQFRSDRETLDNVAKWYGFEDGE